MAKEDTEKLSFEQALNQLEKIVEEIENPQTSLQDGIDRYEEGMGLIKHCRDILRKVEKRIEQLDEQSDTN
jgi:exodeoxyribonuclease VII small subunit